MAPVLNPGSRVENLKNDASAINEQVLISPFLDQGVKNVSIITCPSFAESGQGDFFYVTNRDGTIGRVGAWLDKDNNGTSSAGGEFASIYYLWEVDISTGDTAVQVAGKIAAAMAIPENAVGGGPVGQDGLQVLDNGDGTLTIIEDAVGIVEDTPRTFDLDETGPGSFTAVQSVVGVDSQHVSKYLTIRDDLGNKFHCWCNPDQLGSDPAPVDSTAIEVAFSGGASAATIAASLKNAVDSESEFEANIFGTSQVQIRNRDAGDHADASDQDTNWSISKIRDGSAAPSPNVIVNPAGSPANITNMPTVI